MRITLCQIPIEWERRAENIEHCDNLLEDLFISKTSETDILVLPEFFTYGFTMNGEIAESINGPSVSWMREKSGKYNIAITATVPIRVQDKLFNRAYFIQPDGTEYHYDKRHLFSYGGEDTVYSRGDSNTIVNYKGFNILLQVCYDLRFPVWSRNINLSYDLVINMANWPSSRESVIEPLVRARAIENLCYYAFTNRAGNDPLNTYNPVGFVSDYKGEPMIPEHFSDVFNYKTYNLDINDLVVFRQKFKAWKDADNFKII